MNTDDRVLAYVRTYVPYAIGAGVAWLAAHSMLDFTGPAAAAVTAFAIAVVQNLYYVLIRWAEHRFPLLGTLLGWPRSPEYRGVSDLWGSVVRTGIPPLVAAAVISMSALAADRIGLVVDAQSQTAFIVAGVAFFEAVYFALARWAVSRWSATSVLLGGIAAPPRYPRHAASPPPLSGLPPTPASLTPAPSALPPSPSVLPPSPSAIQESPRSVARDRAASTSARRASPEL